MSAPRGVRSAFRAARSTAFYLLMLGLAFIFLAPFVWMLLASLKTNAQIFSFPPRILPSPARWGNYLRAWTAIPLGRFYLNSLFVSVIVTISQVLTSAMAAFVFARLRFPLRNALFLVYLGVMMVPTQVTVIPLFIIARNLRLTDTYAALILPFLAYPFGAFLMRQFFLTIPVDYEDAARVDGSSRLGMLFRILMPLARPALVTLAMLSFMWEWNSFFWPLIVTNTEDRYTIQVGLAMLKAQLVMDSDWSLLMTAAVISTVPVLAFFIAAQKQVVRGITLSGLKY
jgi:multiple sugar transport system permease protein